MRPLTSQEINILLANGCAAEDWSRVEVSDPFDASRVSRVNFYGTVRMGSNEGEIEVVEGFAKPCGVRNTTLRNVTIGNNSLVEDTTLVACTLANDTDLIIPVLNEAGDGNVMLFPQLSSQIAALQVRYAANAEFTQRLRAICRQSDGYDASCVHIGHHTCIYGAGKLVNSHIGNHCYIGQNVILEGCFVSESSTVTNGFTAEHSLFFANSFMANGEACAAFCGPFSVSHHKGTLLIGVEVSFYNAGSSTNFSNHAYKMGPLHYGTLQRGSKTASGSHTLLPAQVGAFSMCMGKIQSHPDTRRMPFSYLIASADETVLIPARGLLTVGLFRDVEKWPKRDHRPTDDRLSLVSHQWLSPYTVQAIQQGKADLEALLQSHPDSETYRYQGCRIRRHSLLTGIKIYDLALRMAGNVTPSEAWSDLGGMLMPLAEEKQIVEDVALAKITNFSALMARLREIFDRYNQPLVLDADAKREWLEFVALDARKEFELGDVEQDVLDNFLSKLK